MEYKDYYKTLGVSRSASQDEIKRAYRKLARKYHPDVSKDADAEDRFKEVSESYEVLRDPEKRKAYDQLGANWKAGQDFRPPPGWHSAGTGAGDFTGGGFEGFSDFFSTLFGGFGGMGGDRQSGFGGFSATGRRGQDQQAHIRISLQEAFHGTTKQITLQIPEYDGRGQPVSRNRTIKVRIPAGVTAGQQIRLSGQGSSGLGGGKSGDLFLEVEFDPHPHFKAEGRDIYLDLPITPWEASLGAQVKVPTLAGKVDLKIPAGARSGQKMRLKGRGLPGSPAGNQYVVLQIVVPEPHTDEQRELYRRMAEEMPLNPRRHLGV